MASASFPLPGAGRSERKVGSAPNLHRDGAGAPEKCWGVPKVGPRGAGNTDEVKNPGAQRIVCLPRRGWLAPVGTANRHNEPGGAFSRQACRTGLVINSGSISRRAHVRPASEWANSSNDPAVELDGQGVTSGKERRVSTAGYQGCCPGWYRCQGRFHPRPGDKPVRWR